MSALDHRLVAIAPTSTSTVNAFWDGRDEAGNHVGGFGPIERPVYPPNPRGERMAEHRKRGAIGLGRAAAALGLTAEQLSGIEHGRYAFAREEDWQTAEVVVGQMVSLAIAAAIFSKRVRP